MTPFLLPPQGFRHAVDLLLKHGARTLPRDPDRLALDLLALGDDMRARPDFAPWVTAEYERVLRQPAPAALAALGRNFSAQSEPRDLFLIYVPEDRLPIAAPLAVELVKRRISVAFSEYEVDSDAELMSMLTLGLNAHRAGAVLLTADFRRRGLPEPDAVPRLKLLENITSPTTQAEALASWIAGLRPDE